MNSPTHRLRWALSLGLGLGLASGCDQPTGKPRTAPKLQPIIGAKTQDIRDVKEEVKAGGVEVQPRIIAKDPITLQGNAYVSIIGQTSILNIQHALDLYKAETGELPKTRDEFMEKIIQANNIALPKLPFYQEYGYDAAQHKLVIIEYPDRKTQAGYPQ